MRVLEDLKISANEIQVLEILKSLPERAKCLLIATMDEMACREHDECLKYFWLMGFSDYSLCESPIEKILFLAIDIVEFLRESELAESDCLFNVIPQFEIQDGNKKYRVDFNVSLEKCKPPYDSLCNIIVECDGYEFHQKSKRQVKNDNEREMRLKLLGYDVLRFSGTQIYEDPIKCANDIIDFVLIKINK